MIKITDNIETKDYLWQIEELYNQEAMENKFVDINKLKKN